MLLTPVLIFSLAEGWVNFGGGEKDILLAFPYFLWSFIFFVVAVILIVKQWPFKRLLICSGIVSTICIFVLGLVIYVTGWLGVQ